MKPSGMVSSFPGANTLLQGQQINGQTQSEERYRRQKQKTDHRRQINKQIKAADPRRDRHRSEKMQGDQRIRAEEPGPLRDTTSEGPSTL
jgi:hypothetical protein